MGKILLLNIEKILRYLSLSIRSCGNVCFFSSENIWLLEIFIRFVFVLEICVRFVLPQNRLGTLLNPQLSIGHIFFLSLLQSKRPNMYSCSVDSSAWNISSIIEGRLQGTKRRCAHFPEKLGFFEQLLAGCSPVHHSKVKYTWLQSTIAKQHSGESSSQCWVTVDEKDGSVAERIHSPSIGSDRIQIGP